MKESGLKGLIIGAGKMGALADNPHAPWVLSHAHAIASSKGRFSLLGFVDSDPASLKKAVGTWGGEGFHDISDFKFSGKQADIIVIASPDKFHLEHLEKSLELKPKAIVIEKPLTVDLASFYKLFPTGISTVPVIVNYTRRYLDNYKKFFARVKDREFGAFVKGSGHYSKGLLHSGSHLINIILQIFPSPVQSIQILGFKNDFNESDPTIDCSIKFEDGTFFTLESIDAQFYELFEIELFFERARIRIDRLGQRISYFFPQTLISGSEIQYLLEPQEVQEGDAHQAFLNLYEAVQNLVEKRSPIPCDVEDSLRTLNFCERIREKLNEL